MRKTAGAIAGALCAIPMICNLPSAQARQFTWLESITTSDQVVLVTANNQNSTTGTLRTFEKFNDQWKLVQGPSPVFLGRTGLIPGNERVQSSGKTPIGTYSLTSGFGRQVNPGTQMPYTHVDRNDAWTYNPKVPSTYNLFQSANRRWSSYGKYVEHLWQLGPQYDYVVTTSFNEPTGQIVRGTDGINRAKPSANTQLGGGIFLHVSKGIPTAGCISMKRNVMRSLLQWLKPASHPITVIGLASNFNS